MNRILQIGTSKLDLSRTLVMGVLNVTPDSFSDGDKFNTVESAVEHAKRLQVQGADIIDIGGESTRPGSRSLAAEEEIQRVIPVLQALEGQIKVPISIDSYKPEVIEAAVENGAGIINDITGIRDEKVRQLAIKSQLPVIIMHMQGTPQTMQENPSYEDVVKDIYRFFEKQSQLIINEGLDASKIMIDPGIGFGKTLEHNLQLLKRLSEFKSLGFPIVIGTSRKSFIGALTGASVDNRLPGTIASSALAVANGANIVRVHDVAELRQAMQIIDAIN